MISITRRRQADGCSPAERGAYVTDGKRLFRVISPADPALGTADAVLEDCATLRWRIHTVAELFWVPLWRVRPDADLLDGDLRMADACLVGTLRP
jgi:hypothetical protein